MTVLTAVAAGGKWQTAGTWNPAQIPTIADDCIIDGTLEATKTVTVDAGTAKCRSLDCSLMKGKFKVEKTLSIGTTTANGTMALKFGAEGTLEWVIGGTFKFVNTSATEVEVTCAGKDLGEALFEANGGKFKLADKCVASHMFTLGRGTLNLGTAEVETEAFSVSQTEFVRELKMGSSVIKVTGLSFNAAVTTGLTLKAETSTVEFTNFSASTEFKTGGLTYNIVRLASTGAGAVQISGSPTIATLKLDNAGATGGTIITEASTVTITTLTTNAKSGSEAILKSSKAGTAGKFTKAAGNVEVDWLKITDNETNSGVLWYAGANSTLSGLTEFWKKESPGGTVGKLEGVGKVVFAGATAIAGRAAVAGKGPVVFAGTDTLNARAAIAGSTPVRFGQTAALTARAALAATSAVVFGQAASVKARAALAATTTVRFGQKATLSAISGAKRIASRFLFWFDEEEP